MMDFKLNWTENRDPCDECSYSHCIADTPFGRFLLTWKVWKTDISYPLGFDETPWGDIFYGNWDTIEEAKAEAESVLSVKASALMDQLNKEAE